MNLPAPSVSDTPPEPFLEGFQLGCRGIGKGKIVAAFCGGSNGSHLRRGRWSRRSVGPAERPEPDRDQGLAPAASRRRERWLAIASNTEGGEKRVDMAMILLTRPVTITGRPALSAA